jgi:hypothetical protein
MAESEIAGARSDRVEVAGAAVPAGVAEPTAPRPRVVVVAEAWGANWGERAAATRLCAGALALRASVSIVSIEDRSNERYRQPRVRYDGVFPVYSVAAPTGRGHAIGARGPRDLPLHEDLIRASLMRQAGAIVPEVAAKGILSSASLPSTDALVTTMSLEPDAVVLAGPSTFWLGDALPVGADRPRVVVLPLCGDDPVLSSMAFQAVLGPMDAIGAFSGAESDRIARLLGDDADSKLCRLRIALPVNRLAAGAVMAGLSPFGKYVLVISGFDDDPAGGRCPSHEFLRNVFGQLSIAEVRRAGWVVTAGIGRRFDMTWAPTRMNLWRLMAGAEVTVDVRSQGPIGRETIESLLFGTPVVVPDGSVAAEHAKESNGGLWYRDAGEMTDCVRALLDDDVLRSQFGSGGEEWAERNHGDTDGFVETATRLVLGPPPEISTAPPPMAQPA